MKLFKILPVLCGAILPLAPTLVRAQDAPAAPAENTVFKANMSLARTSEKNNKGVALTYYKKALEKALTDDEKAQAQLGIGNNITIRPKNDDPRGDNAARLAAYQAVLDLPGASAAQKITARLGIAEGDFQLEQHEAAQGNFQTVIESTEATDEQKIKARQLSGETLIALKRYDEARARLGAITINDKASRLQKTAAHRTIARSYLRQDKTFEAQAEIKKLAAPGLKDEEAVQVYLSSGDFFREEKKPVLARASYEMIPALSAASGEANIKALLQIGATYFDEKNYAKAREIWAFIPSMRGAGKLTRDAWHSTGVAYTEEKNYAAAREAFSKWREASTSDVPAQVSAWEIIASTFLEEKNYPAARESLANVSKLGANLFNIHDKAQLNLREKMGLVQVYRVEGDFTQAATFSKQILDATPISNTMPLYYYEAHKQVKATAEAMAKERVSMDAAYTLYEALEKHYPYEFNKGEANMAMGDILVAQGKKDEAKAKYQRVIELRKNYDDAKIAQGKIDKLDGKAGA